MIAAIARVSEKLGIVGTGVRTDATAGMIGVASMRLLLPDVNPDVNLGMNRGAVVACASKCRCLA